MTYLEFLLDRLNQEAAEVIQASSKVNQYGLEEVSHLNPSGPTNAQNLHKELVDFLTVAKLLEAGGYIPGLDQPDMEAAKRRKIDYYADYSRAIGTLVDDVEKTAEVLYLEYAAALALGSEDLPTAELWDTLSEPQKNGWRKAALCVTNPPRIEAPLPPFNG